MTKIQPTHLSVYLSSLSKSSSIQYSINSSVNRLSSKSTACYPSCNTQPLRVTFPRSLQCTYHNPVSASSSESAHVKQVLVSTVSLSDTWPQLRPLPTSQPTQVYVSLASLLSSSFSESVHAMLSHVHTNQVHAVLHKQKLSLSVVATEESKGGPHSTVCPSNPQPPKKMMLAPPLFTSFGPISL